MKTIIMLASCIKEAKQFMTNQYGLGNWLYIKPYRYASKGNNFYEFKVISYPSD